MWNRVPKIKMKVQKKKQTQHRERQAQEAKQSVRRRRKVNMGPCACKVNCPSPSCLGQFCSIPHSSLSSRERGAREAPYFVAGKVVRNEARPKEGFRGKGRIEK